MYTRLLLTAGALAAVAGFLNAQPPAMPRRAAIIGGQSGDRGKCTIEVVVDDSAEVEVRGDTAILRTLTGQPAQWRRFECSVPMPANPGDFRFAGVDGRGRQELIRDPRNSGGVAVVRIYDPKAGSEGYTFDLIWHGGGYPPPPDRRDDRDHGDRDRDAYYRDRDEWFRGDNWRGRFFERVRQDLDHAESMTFPISRDEWRIASTKQELNELQGKLAAGRYDERELGDVMAALQRVVQDNRLSPRDRDVLSDDLRRMREFRDHHDDYGARADGDRRDGDRRDGDRRDGDRRDGDRRDGDAYYRDRDDWFRGDNWRQRVFQRVRQDIEHAESMTFPIGRDEWRLQRTKQELDELQDKLAHGRYDERELDEVIDALQRVVQDNRLSGRDRDVLGDDLRRLRDFRERHGDYGAR